MYVYFFTINKAVGFLICFMGNIMGMLACF